jgi:hypothetical protein
LENPPLWVWGIIVGAIIASKFIYRWQATKYFAKEDEEDRRRKSDDDKTKDLRNNNNDFYDNINKSDDITNIRSAHKYSPRHYYKDYFAIKKKNKK